jgi:hypothetical protein
VWARYCMLQPLKCSAHLVKLHHPVRSWVACSASTCCILRSCWSWILYHSRLMRSSCVCCWGLSCVGRLVVSGAILRGAESRSIRDSVSSASLSSSSISRTWKYLVSRPWKNVWALTEVQCAFCSRVACYTCFWFACWRIHCWFM